MARYGGVLTSLGGIMKGVLENGVLRRYGVGDLGCLACFYKRYRSYKEMAGEVFFVLKLQFSIKYQG
jgi:hypothetical protein